MALNIMTLKSAIQMILLVLIPLKIVILKGFFTIPKMQKMVVIKIIIINLIMLIKKIIYLENILLFILKHILAVLQLNVQLKIYIKE